MSNAEQYGPAVVTCPYCLEEVEVAAGETRRCEIQHGDCDWMVVDLAHETAGITSNERSGNYENGDSA